MKRVISGELRSAAWKGIEGDESETPELVQASEGEEQSDLSAN